MTVWTLAERREKYEKDGVRGGCGSSREMPGIGEVTAAAQLHVHSGQAHAAASAQHISSSSSSGGGISGIEGRRQEYRRVGIHSMWYLRSQSPVHPPDCVTRREVKGECWGGTREREFWLLRLSVRVGGRSAAYYGWNHR